VPAQRYLSALTQAAVRATAEAERLWAARAASPGRRYRIVGAARLAWDAAYPIAYTHGYTAFATRAAATVEDVLHRDPAWATAPRNALRLLTQAARDARPGKNPPPDPPPSVLEEAAIAVMNRRDGSTAPAAITAAVHRQAIIYGGMHGALAAATDIDIAWRARLGRPTLAAPVGSVSLGERVNALLAELNRDTVAVWMTRTAEPTPLSLVRASFAAPATIADTFEAGAHERRTVVPIRRRSRG